MIKDMADKSLKAEEQLMLRKKVELQILEKRKKVKERLLSAIDRADSKNISDVTHDIIESLKISGLPNKDKAEVLVKLKLRKQILENLRRG